MRSASKCFLQKVTIGVVSLWPSVIALRIMRKINRIQLLWEELFEIVTVIRSHRPCRVLVFGVGNDTLLWHSLNRGGRTVFLEDNDEWLSQATGQRTDIEAYKVEYTTVRDQWEDDVEEMSFPRVTLPDAVLNTDWDIIIVDGPAGCNDSVPGRVQSIFEASRLGCDGSHIFVHDVNRALERTCCDRFLDGAQFLGQTKVLRHYILPDGDAERKE